MKSVSRSNCFFSHFVPLPQTRSLIGWLYLGQASVITSSTLKIEQLQQEIALIDQQNAELSLEIAQIESLSQVKERARILGFTPVDPTAIRYLPIDEYPTTIVQDGPTLVQSNNEAGTLWQFWLDSITAWLVGTPIKD